MRLKELQLLNFKNHLNSKWEFKDDAICFIGDNGSGKTNILDAIHYLCLTKSYFNSGDISSINFDENYFTIKGRFTSKTVSSEIICSFIDGEGKSIKNNDKKYTRFSDHIGEYPVIFISPTDTSLINEASDIRRRYIDSSISQFNSSYLKTLISYKKTLRQRNQLLKNFYETNTFDNNTLSTYNEILVNFGLQIYSARKVYLNKLIPVFQKYYNKISDNSETVNIKYNSQLNEGDFLELLSKNTEKDRVLKYTSVGVHKDDISFELNNHNLKKHGSQGQQKSFLISLKLSQLEFINQEMGICPILLLDDIFDKLDTKRIQRLMSCIEQGVFKQVFITDTDNERIENIFKSTNISHLIFHI